MASFDNYTNYKEGAGVTSVVFGSDKPLLEVELNEVQEIIKSRNRNLISKAIGDFISICKDDCSYDADTKKLSISNMYAIQQGYVIDATDATFTIENIAKTDKNVGIYLIFWEETVDYQSQLKTGGNQLSNTVVENWFKDSRSTDETSRRKVLKYTLSKNNSVVYNDKQKSVCIAKVNRGTFTLSDSVTERPSSGFDFSLYKQMEQIGDLSALSPLGYNKTMVQIVNKISSDFDYPDAGFHNSRYRGKNIGGLALYDSVIESGAFTDLYIGDYFTDLDGITWRIAAFDYWYGSLSAMKHHIVIVPDTCLSTAPMESSPTINSTGYKGSSMYLTSLNDAKDIVLGNFDENKLLTRFDNLSNHITSEGIVDTYDTTQVTLGLMDEIMLFGRSIFGKTTGYGVGSLSTSKSILPLFQFRPDLTKGDGKCLDVDNGELVNLASDSGFSLKDICDTTHYVGISVSSGVSGTFDCRKELGVRPIFGYIGG